MEFRRPIEALIPDAQGRILATLTRTTEELTLTTLADLSGVSLAHVARVVPRLVELGVVDRRDVPPAALVRLARDNLAARLIAALGDLRQALLEELRTSAGAIDPAPVNVTLFGSFARGDDDAASDIDVVVVRPIAVDEDDPTWSESIAHWEAHVRCASGNTLNRLEVAADEVPRLVMSRRPLWRAIVREGTTLQGRPLAEIGGAVLA
jgi:nucleotidyltransferase-like protein/IclR-like helix-turn-helix domain-containing protein